MSKLGLLSAFIFIFFIVLKMGISYIETEQVCWKMFESCFLDCPYSDFAA